MPVHGIIPLYFYVLEDFQMNLISCEKARKEHGRIAVLSSTLRPSKAAVNNAFKREAKLYAIPGFRRARLPRHMIEKDVRF